MPGHRGGRRQAAEERVAEAAYAPGALAQEPRDQTAMASKFAPDQRGAQRQGAGSANLAQKLGPPVEVLGIRDVALHIGTAPAAEDAIGAEVDQLRLFSARWRVLVCAWRSRSLAMGA